jgi:hypothetical protein
LFLRVVCIAEERVMTIIQRIEVLAVLALSLAAMAVGAA